MFDALGRDRYVRAVVLTRAGKDFSIGADMSEFDRIRDNKQRAARQHGRKCAAVDRRRGSNANGLSMGAGALDLAAAGRPIDVASDGDDLKEGRRLLPKSPAAVYATLTAV
jgi:enoyl-CoA hydratase/carnithine racemase